MSTRQGIRWYIDPHTGLPTIRRHPDAREYQTVDEVKRMIADERRAVGGDDYDDDHDPDRCSDCDGPGGLHEDK